MRCLRKKSRKREEEGEEEVEEEAAQPKKATTSGDKTFSMDEVSVIARINEVDRLGRVQMREGNLGYLKTRHQIGELLETNFGGKDRQERAEAGRSGACAEVRFVVVGVLPDDAILPIEA